MTTDDWVRERANVLASHYGLASNAQGDISRALHEAEERGKRAMREEIGTLCAAAEDNGKLAERERIKALLKSPSEEMVKAVSLLVVEYDGFISNRIVAANILSSIASTLEDDDG